MTANAFEARFGALLAVAADAILELDGDEKIVAYEGGAERVFGWTKEEILSQPRELLLPERLPDARAQRSGPRTVQARRKSGEEFPAEIKISSFELAGRARSTIAVRDVTDRVRREREQRRHLAEQGFLAELDTVFASSLDYQETLTRTAELMTAFFTDLAIVDLVEQEKIARVRAIHADPTKSELAAALARFSVTRPSFIAPVLEKREPLLVGAVEPASLHAMAETDEERRVLGELAPKSFMSIPLLARGHLLGVLTLISTRSEHAYTERDLGFAIDVGRRAALAVDNARLYRTAREAIAARDDILGIVAHDLRSPLGGIRMVATRIARQTTESNPSVAEYSTEIVRAGERMDKLIQSLLDVTRIEAGKLTVNAVPVKIEVLVAELKKACTPALAAEDMSLIVQVADGVPDVLADLDRLLQVFTNLTGNSAKFALRGSEVTVAIVPKGAEVEVSVIDRGPGLTPEQVAHLFDRFWQANTGERRGAGLGMAIVKGIVESHGGHVTATSELGRGTTISFTLRAA